MSETVERLLDEKGLLRVDKNGTPITRDLCIATAALMMHTAMADSTMQDYEISAICRALNRQFEMSDADAGLMMEVADYLWRDNTQLDSFLSLVNERLERAQKITVTAMLWKVMISDGLASEIEANFAARVAEAFALTPGDIVRAKRMVQHGEV